MSSSNTSNTPPQSHMEDQEQDPLHLLEEKIRELNEEEVKINDDHHQSSGIYKRKQSTEIQSVKKLKVKPTENTEDEMQGAALDFDGEKENQKLNIAIEQQQQTHEEILRDEEKVIEDTNDNDKKDLKSEEKQNDEGDADKNNDGSSKDKKDKEKKEHHERKVQNLRKNIKDVLDDSQLDATTLAAQRLESERLARLQEAQRLMRETQRQMAAEKYVNKTQQKVLSLLGESNEPVDSAIDLDDPLFERFTLNSSINVTQGAREAIQSIQSLISTDEKVPDSDDDDVIIQPDVPPEKSVVVDSSSSDSDDCIILSDEEEEEEDDEDDDSNSGEHTNDAYNQPDSEGRVVVNIGHSEKESDIYVAPQIARIIKPHQIGGVRFLYDNIIESIELFEKSSGFGCILAHSMGLGKTLQLVCFCDIFLRHTCSNTILIIMPINTLQNWVNEFNMWIPLPEDVDKCPLKEQGEVRPRNFKIFVLNDSHKSLNMRAKIVLEWKNGGGVLMMGYEMYRLLSLKKVKQKRRRGFVQNPDVPSNEDQDLFDKITEALVNPGPDLVVCDEGHRIKNASASTSLALKQIKSKRRVVLTGYPLQNNLLEYWCMVDFVRPSYLGTKTEFSNMFERPIQNGQCIDSTPQDCKLMRYRAHVLHSLLKGFVQRRSHAVLQKCLPEKTEFVLLVRLTSFQRKLYTVFMDEVVRSKKVPNPLKAFAVCCKIWNHPDVLYNFLKKRELDLEIELEEAESDRKNENCAISNKKRGRKVKEKDKQKDSLDVKEKSTEAETEINPIKLGGTSKNIPLPDTSFKPPMTPSNSNDSAYSSNQSLSSSYENAGNYNSSYPNYQNYESNPYQSYNYGNTNGNGYQQNWNGGAGSNYWQNNYYHQSEYYHSSSYQSYYGNQNSTMTDTKTPLLPPTPIAPRIDSQQPPIIAPSNIVDSQNRDVGEKKNVKNDNDAGLLLADVIQKEQQEKNITNKDDISDSIILKSSSRDDGIPYDWAVDLMKDYVPDLLENSPKMEIFFCILEESIKMGDRILVFSQSLLTLNLLERFLHKMKIPNTENNWAKNQSYFRLDGSTPALEREKLINEFNANTNLKLFLVSTRAGSLGINLVGANRVVVFDASWNPCHDTQAVCRVYRYGQAKSCFVYRLVVDNCLEKKIYDRQINKQGMADRVIDECNPDAHLSLKEVTSLCYDDGEDPELTEFGDQIENYTDDVTKKILCNFSKALTKEPFQHESLLVDRKEKKLSQAEKRLAQRGYEMEKQAAAKPTYNFNPSIGTNYRLYRTTDGTLIQRPIVPCNRVQVVNSSGELTPNIQTPMIRPEAPKPNRWVPVEVWQSKGITAQEMTLPQDVSIQTNSADKSKIFLKAGQKVIVLKSPRGICLQLESGKVIAIRASMKPGQGGQSSSQNDSGLPSFPGITDATSTEGIRKIISSGNPNEIIDMTNSDDEEMQNKNIEEKATLQPINGSSAFANEIKKEVGTISTNNLTSNTEDSNFKEKAVYKPNLIQRKPKMPPTITPSISSQPQESGKTSSYETGYQSQQKTNWDRFENTSTSYPYRDINGGAKTDSLPFRNPYSDSAEKTTSESRPSGSSSAFHAPPSVPVPAYQNSSYMQPPPPHYQTHPTSYTAPSANYQSSSYNYPPPPNYNYYQTPYSSTSRNYHYPQHSNFDTQYPSYHHPHHGGYNNQYTQPPPPILPNSYPSSSTNVPPTTAASSTSPTNYNQWNWNSK